MGNLGRFYKYYPVSGDCKSTIEQKTVAGTIQYIIKQLEGNYLCNIYSCTVSYHGTWHGTIIVGPSNKVWYSNIGSTKYRGCWDKGCAELQSPYNCNSKQEGAWLNILLFVGIKTPLREHKKKTKNYQNNTKKNPSYIHVYIYILSLF